MKADWRRSIPHRMLVASAMLMLASPVFAAPYTLKLTSVGDGANNGSVYYSPYVGTVSQGGKQIYSGYLVCDDFNTHTNVGQSWGATETNAGALNGTEKFAGETYMVGAQTYTTQQMYDAAGWLVNQLLPGNATNQPVQANISFAIWDIFDGTQAGGAVETDIVDAFNEVTTDHYVASNIEVFTPVPSSASQEFLIPVSVPEPAALVLFAVGLAGIGFRLRSRHT